MSTKSLCERFTWSAASELRNELTTYYEPIQPFVLLALAKHVDSGVFIDAGANIGFYTVVIGSESTIAEVYAFEPMPMAAAAVRWNAHENLASKPVRVIEAALSDRQGMLAFAVVGSTAGDNGALADSTYAHDEVDVSEVRCSKLDDEISHEGRDILLKVDVEGHELSLLRGAQRTLGENRGFMQIEIHPESPSREETIQLLGELGWQQLLRVGPDHYFTNVPEAINDPFRVALLDDAMDILVESSKSGQRASRRRIAPGVYLEVSRRKADAIKRLLRR